MIHSGNQFTLPALLNCSECIDTVSAKGESGDLSLDCLLVNNGDLSLDLDLDMIDFVGELDEYVLVVFTDFWEFLDLCDLQDLPPVGVSSSSFFVIISGVR